MLIDLLIIILVSVLYYLMCSLSRIINLVIGMLIIFLLCWSVGVNVEFDTTFSEIGFIVIALFINLWMTLYSRHIVTQHSISRMSKFHHRHHNNHVYALRNRVNNFRIKSFNDHFRATPKVYLKTINHQVNHLNDYVQHHSKYSGLRQLIKSFEKIPKKLDQINYHLDLPLQVNLPHGLKRLTHQYHQIERDYQNEELISKQETHVVHILSHGAQDPASKNVFLHVNLRFPYQRLIHDRVTHQIDLLVINSRGVFAFTLLVPKKKVLNVNKNDEVSRTQVISKRYQVFKSVINLKERINHDYEAINYIIPNDMNVIPHMAIICTDPKTKIQVTDPKFKIIKPQSLSKAMLKIKPILNNKQVYHLVNVFRDCFTRDKKFSWHVFDEDAHSVVFKLLWYQSQVKALENKLVK